VQAEKSAEIAELKQLLEETKGLLDEAHAQAWRLIEHRTSGVHPTDDGFNGNPLN
jgi:cellobiose-specific phosphotransferase system component IIA